MGRETRCGGTGATLAATSSPLPKAAAWLNRIEGFWKILGQRALAGRASASAQEVDVDAALHAGVADWTQQPTPFLWGRPPTPTRELKRTSVYRI